MISSEEIIKALLEHPKQQDALGHLGLSRQGLHKRARNDPSIARVLELLRSDKKDALVQCLVTPRVKEQLEQKASEAGVPLSEYVRGVLEVSLK